MVNDESDFFRCSLHIHDLHLSPFSTLYVYRSPFPVQGRSNVASSICRGLTWEVLYSRATLRNQAVTSSGETKTRMSGQIP